MRGGGMECVKMAVAVEIENPPLKLRRRGAVPLQRGGSSGIRSREEETGKGKNTARFTEGLGSCTP